MAQWVLSSTPSSARWKRLTRTATPAIASSSSGLGGCSRRTAEESGIFIYASGDRKAHPYHYRLRTDPGPALASGGTATPDERQLEAARLDASLGLEQLGLLWRDHHRSPGARQRRMDGQSPETI